MKRSCAALLFSALPAFAGGMVELPRAPVTSFRAAPYAAPAIAAARPAAAASWAAPALASPASSLSAVAAPSAVSAAPAAAASAQSFSFIERRGKDQFGRDVLLIDALDDSVPSRGTVGHVDVLWRGDSASLDQPLDFWVDKTFRPDGVPPNADLSHFREYLWFGLAVLPAYRAGGLGGRLLDAAVSRLKAEGVRTLFIRATETSLTFYQARFGTRVRAVEREDAGEDGGYYRLEIAL